MEEGSMQTIVTGYLIAKTGEFKETNAKLNGNFNDYRKRLEREHGSEVYFRISEPPHGLVEQIINAVAAEYCMWPEDVFQDTRKRKVVEPRQMMHYFLKKWTPLSLQDIADRTGGRDHATVLHSIKKVGNPWSMDDEMKEHFNNIKNAINP